MLVVPTGPQRACAMDSCGPPNRYVNRTGEPTTGFSICQDQHEVFHQFFC